MLDHLPYYQYILSACIGIGLAAASGFRVFLPLFAVSLASYMHWIDVGDNFQWLAGLPALITTGIAMIIEILAYYIPYVDNVLDSINVPLAGAAGAILFASQFTHMDSFTQWALAIIAGSGTAATISSGFAGTRAASTATTGGIGNFLVASTETIGSTIMSVLALIAPFLAIVFVFMLLYLIVRYGRKLYNKYRKYKEDSLLRN